jgi:hypothetical protein
MVHVPVLAIVSQAYQFAIQNYLKLLGILWVPFVLMVAVMAWQFDPMMSAIAQPATKSPAVALAMLGHVLIFEAAVFVLLIIMTVGITRLALGKEVRWTFFYLAIGADFWRLLLAYFLLSLIMIVAVFALSILIGIVGAALAISAGGVRAGVGLAILTLIGVLAVYALFLVGGVRLGFLLAPIVILEKRIGIGRNWTLTRGNTMRLLGLVILILLPLIVLVCLQYFLMAVFGGPDMNVLAGAGNPQAQVAWSRAMMESYRHYWFIYFPVGFLLGPIFYGPLLSAGAFAYRALHPEEPSNVF